MAGAHILRGYFQLAPARVTKRTQPILVKWFLYQPKARCRVARLDRSLQTALRATCFIGIAAGVLNAGGDANSGSSFHPMQVFKFFTCGSRNRILLIGPSSFQNTRWLSAPITRPPRQSQCARISVDAICKRCTTTTAIMGFMHGALVFDWINVFLLRQATAKKVYCHPRYPFSCQGLPEHGCGCNPATFSVSSCRPLLRPCLSHSAVGIVEIRRWFAGQIIRLGRYASSFTFSEPTAEMGIARVAAASAKGL